MGRSIAPPDPLPPGRVVHGLSGSVITIDSDGAQMIHRISERGLTAEYPVAYQIGSGRKGRTFAVQIGNYLLESPVSWYRGHGWDVSPGFENLALLDVDRPVTSSCLFCHAGRTKFADADGRRLANSPVGGITCDRCHGSGEDHALHPTKDNIVNPAKLSGARRESICEQCHLEGDTRIVNAGRKPEDYRPGELLENTIVTYLLQRAGEQKPAVTQVEELAESQCVRQSGDRLWCGTCHNPHAEVNDRPRQIRDVCMSCHRTLSKQAHPKVQVNCVTCHMPPRPTSNIAHIAVTDHRIQRPASLPENRRSQSDTLFAWREPQADLRQRDLALAEMEVGYQQHLPAMLQGSIKLLETLPAAQQADDPDVLSNLEVVYLGTSAPEKAVTLAQWAVDAAPQSATFALNLGIALKRTGRLEKAERQLHRAIRLDPSLMQAYAELAVLYDGEHRTAEAMQTLEQFLKWNPQNIQFRLALEH